MLYSIVFCESVFDLWSNKNCWLCSWYNLIYSFNLHMHARFINFGGKISTRTTMT